jgi:hypothetical protein
MLLCFCIGALDGLNRVPSEGGRQKGNGNKGEGKPAAASARLRSGITG